MAFALVGSLGTVATGTNSASPTFAQSTTAGNLLILWATTGSSGGISTTPPTGWSLGKQSTAQLASIFYKANCAAGETAPTVGTSGVISALLGEFSGGDTSAPLDQTGVGNNAATTPIVSTNAAVDATSGELFITAVLWVLSKAGTCNTADTYTNATATGNLSNDATSITGHYRFAYGITTANAVADSNSESNNSMNLSTAQSVCCSFKLAAAVYQPRNPGVNFQDPGVFMERRNWLWLPKRPKVWRPSLEPIPAFAV